MRPQCPRTIVADPMAVIAEICPSASPHLPRPISYGSRNYLPAPYWWVLSSHLARYLFAASSRLAARHIAAELMLVALAQALTLRQAAPGLIIHADLSTQAQFRNVVLQERRVELAFENQRWYDLVRTGRAVDALNAQGVLENPQRLPDRRRQPSNDQQNPAAYSAVRGGAR